MSNLQALNQQQLVAVEYDEGPSLVIAGAGSGKTRVLTNKIIYLIEHGYEPGRILALTFTNKAAREMKSRIAELIGPHAASRLWMGTFHSIFLKILRNNSSLIGYKTDFTIYDASDSKTLIKNIIRDMGFDDKTYVAGSVQSVISYAKNALILPEEYMADPEIQKRDKIQKRPAIGQIYSTYCQRCRISGAMDFDDILLYTNILLRDNPNVLEKYQNFFQYILVDEYQDTNFSQYLIINRLGEKNMKFCLVGDDAQSIYSFRGANISNILTLNKKFPHLKTFKLEQNYRSTQNILDTANSLIEKNRQQIPKKIFSTNPKGSKVLVLKAYSDIDESFLVANKVLELKMLQGDSFDDYAILYRTNAQSRVLEESFRKRNIRYRIYGGVSFYQRKEVKDVLSYFRLAVNPNDDEAVKRVINYPARGIGEKTIAKIRFAATEANVSMWDIINNPVKYELNVSSGTLKKLQTFRQLISDYSDKSELGMPANELADYIYETSGLDSLLKSDKTPENISRQENITELLEAVRQYVEGQKESGYDSLSMVDFLSEVSLATDQDENEEMSPKVTMMTVHAAKGLEFSNVIIVGVEDEFFPSARNADSIQGIEEERRLLYVAITRAKTNCIMTYAISRYLNGQTRLCTPSRFLKDIDPNLLTISGSLGFKQKTQSDYAKYQNPMPQQLRSLTSARPEQLSQNFSSKSTGAYVERETSLTVGTKIKHERFGFGEILSIDKSTGDTKIKVRFENAGEKVLLTKYAKFTVYE